MDPERGWRVGDAFEFVRRKQGEIIIARENEISTWLDKGGDPAQLYKDYTGHYAITKMLIDLKWVRSE